MSVPCVTVTGFGFVSDLTFNEWIAQEIQDEETAVDVARSMLAYPQNEYVYNEASHPTHYREFLISNIDEFKRCFGILEHEYA